MHIHRAINGAVLRKKIREREKHKKLPLHDVGVWLRETLHYVFFTWIIFQREIWDHWRSFFYVEIFPTKQAHQEKHGFCNPLIESLKGKTMHNNASAAVGAHHTYSCHLYSLVVQSLGPPLQEEGGGTEKSLAGEGAKSNQFQQFCLKCGTLGPTLALNPLRSF